MGEIRAESIDSRIVPAGAQSGTPISSGNAGGLAILFSDDLVRIFCSVTNFAEKDSRERLSR
jgi:hypothetical protein